MELEEDKGNKHFLDRKCLIKLSNLPPTTSPCIFFCSCTKTNKILEEIFFPKQVKLKAICQHKKERCKKSFQYLHPVRKENLTLFTSTEILDENLNY